MTVEELIEELKRQPNQRVVVRAEVGEWRQRVDYVRFDGNAVVLETKP